jgi:beta-fructofuranosidase
VVLRLSDKWIWDFWIADTGAEFHLFYLQAPKALGEQSLRHQNASVGHAISTDLRSWQVLPDALGPGPTGAWDDLAVWTGSVIAHEDVWHLLYTGTTPAAKSVGQRLGLATSSDLVAWAKHDANPVLVLDPRWYELVEFDAWRDPWLLRDPDGDGFHALITARATSGPDDARGVIGHAWSANLVDWEIRAPLSEPGEFGHLEVPQVEVVAGTPVLLFSVGPDRFSAERRARHPGETTGTFVAIGDSLLGPWDIAGARRIPVPDLYSARLVQDRAGQWQVLGFLDGSAHDAFIGEISDPIPFSDLGLL